MLYVDSRAGSCELIEPLREAGLEVEVCQLPAGDIMFEGKGEGGRPVSIGIEHKKLPDLVQSLRTERLAGHQLVEMCDTLDYRWLFVQGELLYDKRGKLLKRTGRQQFRPMGGGMTVGELLKRVFVMHLRGGLNPWWTQNRRESVTAIEMLYRVWTDKALDEHTSHLAMYQPPTLVPVSDERAILAKLPGIGFKASAAVEAHFGGSLIRAFNAPVEEWAEIATVDEKTGKTRRIGMKVATRVVRFIRNEEDGL